MEFVTNLTVSSVLDIILGWDRELLKHLQFKCSFHYIQLKEKGLLNLFVSNVRKVWAAGASATIEITPHDELIPYIDEVMLFSKKNFGALPHITIARNDAVKGKDYLTKLPIAEYDKIWSKFDSEFWQFKKKIFMVRRKEFCYAGEWLLQVNLATGVARQCYKTNYTQNIFENIDKQIYFMPIGHCKESHCYNGHMLLTLGCIPDFTKVGYGDIRDKTKKDGSTWLTPEMKNFLNKKLWEHNNYRYSKLERCYIILKNRYYLLKRIMHKLSNMIIK